MTADIPSPDRVKTNRRLIKRTKFSSSHIVSECTSSHPILFTLKVLYHLSGVLSSGFTQIVVRSRQSPSMRLMSADIFFSISDASSALSAVTLIYALSFGSVPEGRMTMLPHSV